MPLNPQGQTMLFSIVDMRALLYERCRRAECDGAWYDSPRAAGLTLDCTSIIRGTQHPSNHPAIHTQSIKQSESIHSNVLPFPLKCIYLRIYQLMVHKIGITNNNYTNQYKM